MAILEGIRAAALLEKEARLDCLLRAMDGGKLATRFATAGYG